MTALIYKEDRISMDGRSLAYIQAVTGHVFREGSGFMLGLTGTDSAGNMKIRVLWMHPTISVQFIYRAGETIQLNEETFGVYYNAARAGHVDFGNLDTSPPYTLNIENRNDGE
ncbi:hypothetical protein [Rhodococcus jostii]|uniref:DUF7882 family protein n=1 Tax=Rhodococcus jostii TaxID=132919 RepID=UPI00362B4333